MATTTTPPTTPDKTKPGAAPAATPEPATTTRGPRSYVVLEEAKDGTISRAGKADALNPKDACWKLVEEAGSDLNNRARTDNPPKLHAEAASSFSFEAYALEVETVTKRKQ